VIADPPHRIAEHRSRLLQRRYRIPRRTAAIPSDPVKSCVPVVVAFNASNYVDGITKVGFWPYVLATAGGMLPGTLLYVYLGAAGKAGLGGGSKEHSSLEYVFFGVGLVATIGVTIWVSRIAKNALKESGAAKKKDDP